MSLLDKIFHTSASDAPDSTPSPLVSAILTMLSQSGGIQGLAQQFNAKGLGRIVQSWIGTGENLPVSAEQIQSVFGSIQLQGIAEKAGLSPEAASTGLAKILPELINGLTPNGEIPSGDPLSKGAEFVGQKIAS